MSWGFVAAGAATVIGGAISADASKDAAGEQADAANRATQAQNDQLNRTRADTAIARQAGNIALRELVGGIGGDLSKEKSQENFDAQAYLAANPDVARYAASNGTDPWTGHPMDPTQFAISHYFNQGVKEGREFTGRASESQAPSAPGTASNDFNRDFTLADFQKDPGYDFRLNQGLGSVQGSAAARGSLMSGATLKALNDYGSDYASSEYGKAYDRFNNDRTQRFNRLATIAGIGQTATNNVGTLGANNAGMVGSNMIGAGNAAAAGQVGQANAITGGISNLQSLYQMNQMNGGNYSKPLTSGNSYYGANGGQYANHDLSGTTRGTGD